MKEALILAKDKILIVEDEKSVADLIEAVLDSFGYETVGVIDTGEEAIEKASELDPDLILMDIMLAGDMKGIEAADLIQKILDAPILFLTGCVEDDIVKQAINTGPYSYLVKPFDKSELHSNIELALSKHKIRKDLESNKEKYRSLAEDALDSTSVGILILDSKNEVVWLNKTFEEYTGWKKSQLIGEDYIKFLEKNASDFVVNHEKYLEKILKAFKDKNYKFNLEINCRSLSKKRNLWLEHKSKPIKKGLYEGGQVELFYDISSKKSQKKKLSDKERNLNLNSQKVIIKKALDPAITNKELSEQLDLHPSTISTIFNKLRDPGIIEEKYTPNIFNINKGKIKMFKAKFKHRFSKGVKENITHLGMHPGEPLITISDFISFMSIGFNKNKEKFDTKYRGDINDYSKKMTFDFQLLELDVKEFEAIRFFNYGPLLNKYFEVDIIQDEDKKLKPPINKNEWSPDSFKQKEKDVFYTLLQNPNSSDYEDSKKLDLSHPTFTKIRRSLIDKEAIYQYLSIDFPKIGLSHLIMTYIDLDEESSEADPYGFFKYLEDYRDNIVSCLVTKGDKIILLSIFKSVKETNSFLEKVVEYLSSKLISQENLDFVQFYMNKNNYSQVVNLDKIMEEIF